MLASIGPQILVVDPDDRLQELFRDLFLLEGYSVDVQSALESGCLREISPVAVVYGLGWGNEAAGIATLRSLLENRSPACGTVVCTADPAQIKKHREALIALEIPIASKPFNIEDLLGIIQGGITRAPGGNGRLHG